VVVHVPLGEQREVSEGHDPAADQVPDARGALRRRNCSGLSTPTAMATSARPAATSMHAWRNAVEPEAEAFSTWAIGIPVAPRCRYIRRDIPMAVVAVPV
jgi:hypothetical protein